MFLGASHSPRKTHGSRTVVVSGGGWARAGAAEQTRPVAPAAESPARKRRRLCKLVMKYFLSCSSSLQFALEFVEEAPVGVAGNELIRGLFDYAQFTQPQREEADGVRGVVVAP